MVDIPIDQVMAVMQAAFDPFYGEAWNRRQVEDALAFPHTHLITIGPSRSLDAVDDVAGFAMTRRAADEEELLLIAIRPDMRGQGLGKALLLETLQRAAEAGVSRIFLEMRQENPARLLYEGTGFEPIGSRKRYYRTSDGTFRDAVTYARSLPNV